MEQEPADSPKIDEASALSNSVLSAEANYQPDPFYKTWGLAIAKFLVKIVLYLLGLVFDVLKALYTLVKDVLIGLYKGVLGIKKLAVWFHRAWNDMDLFGKIGFFVMGAGHLRRKQWLDGFFWLALEIAFAVYMFLPLNGAVMGTGMLNLDTFFYLNDEAELVKKSGEMVLMGTKDAVVPFINGFVTLVVVLGFVWIYVLYVQANYDNYLIVHEQQFKQARLNGIFVLEHPDEFSEDLSKLNRFQIKRLMRQKYGYSELSSRYISHLDFKRLARPTPRFVALKKGWADLQAKVLVIYGKFCSFVHREYEWMSPWGRFTEYVPAKKKDCYGREVLLAEAKAELIRFSHKYDKYNNCLAYLRDEKALASIYAQSDKVVDALFARDHVSASNGLKPLALDSKITVREAESRLVGAFEIQLPLAQKVASVAIRFLNIDRKSLGPTEAMEAKLKEELANEGQYHAANAKNFERINIADRIAEEKGLAQIYADAIPLSDNLAMGRPSFEGYIIENYEISKRDAAEVYKDFKGAQKRHKDDLNGYAAELALRGKHAGEFATYIAANPFHGQPTLAHKRVKEFSDEKFAVTVLSLPVIAAVIVCIVPLLCSMAVAFTNWDSYHVNNKFVWDTSAWSQVVNLFSSNGEQSTYAYTFFHLLLWTLVWAFFATFTNYFFGIILALLINRKSIKLKKMWRTIFVITIAIPQFITLLVMNHMLSQNGLINTWLMTQDWYTGGFSQFLGFGNMVTDSATGVESWQAYGIPFISGPGASAHNAFYPKLTCILVNMWVGIPYTMLSTSGILMNIPEDLYESSKIDGAGPARQLFSITMPYVLFVTGPALLTQFIGNINNFNVIYFLTGGAPTGTNPLLDTSAGETDLLITWLYKLTVNFTDYSIASVIGILIFLVCAFFSLIAYSKLGSVKNEEDFQ
jgi:ABC-type sugar transport system permease subunit